MLQASRKSSAPLSAAQSYLLRSAEPAMFAAIGSPMHPQADQALYAVRRDTVTSENFLSSPGRKIQTEIAGETLFRPPCCRPIHHLYYLQTNSLSNPIRRCSRASWKDSYSAPSRT